jgi:hypothetical protein
MKAAATRARSSHTRMACGTAKRPARTWRLRIELTLAGHCCHRQAAQRWYRRRRQTSPPAASRPGLRAGAGAGEPVRLGWGERGRESSRDRPPSVVSPRWWAALAGGRGPRRGTGLLPGPWRIRVPPCHRRAGQCLLDQRGCLKKCTPGGSGGVASAIAVICRASMVVSLLVVACAGLLAGRPVRCGTGSLVSRWDGGGSGGASREGGFHCCGGPEGAEHV